MYRFNAPNLFPITQLLTDLAESNTPIFAHKISTLKETVDSKPKEQCPFFAHARIDKEKDSHLFEDHIVVPNSKLYTRYVGYTCLIGLFFHLFVQETHIHVPQQANAVAVYHDKTKIT